jgi:hypothetical protein
VRLISLGLCAGLLVSTFSRSLALILGLLVVGVQVSLMSLEMGIRGKGEVLMRRQWASSYGIHIIPYNRLQKYVTSIDLRSAVQDNVAFKVSFGTTFALAAFMHF